MSFRLHRFNGTREALSGNVGVELSRAEQHNETLRGHGRGTEGTEWGTRYDGNGIR